MDKVKECDLKIGKTYYLDGEEGYKAVFKGRVDFDTLAFEPLDDASDWLKINGLVLFSVNGYLYTEA